MRSAPGPPQNLICSECGDEFTLQSQLAVHMEEHRQELAANRVHTCKACGKELETSSQLKEHMKTHYKIRYEPLLGHEGNLRDIIKTGELRRDWLEVLAALATSGAASPGWCQDVLTCASRVPQGG